MAGSPRLHGHSHPLCGPAEFGDCPELGGNFTSRSYAKTMWREASFGRRLFHRAREWNVEGCGGNLCAPGHRTFFRLQKSRRFRGVQYTTVLAEVGQGNFRAEVPQLLGREAQGAFKILAAVHEGAHPFLGEGMADRVGAKALTEGGYAGALEGF